MRVLQMIDTLSLGGAQKMQLTLAKVMPEYNIQLTVLSLRKNTSGTPTADLLRALNVPVHFFQADKLLDPVRIWQITRFLRRERFDLIHTHLGYANTIGTLTGRLAGIPTIASLRNIQPDSHPIRRGLETWLLRHWAQRVMAVGHATAAAHQKRLHSQQIEGIPNAIAVLPSLSSTERIKLRAKLVGNPTRPLLISVGRLMPQKGYSDLLQAFSGLRQTHPTAALLIVGDGKLRADLEAQITALNLEGHVTLLGARYDIPRLLAASDLFISSSLWEGLPVAVLEAMAVGLPVVATRVSDVPYVVVEGTGLIVPPREPAALTEAVSSLLDDPKRMQSFGAAARIHIAANHNPTQWAKRILALYQEALCGKPVEPAVA